MTTSYSFSELLEWKPNEENDWILGNGFLSRGQAILISADAGVGKSTFAQHLAYSLTLGRDFVGLKTHGPSRVLYIQNENSTDDLAECAKGFHLQNKLLARDLKVLNAGYRAHTVLDHSGQELAHWLKGELTTFKPDVLILDPLFAYMGCDATDQKSVTGFLRGAMAPLLRDFNCAWVCIHHNKKDRRDSGSGPKAFGSVEIPAYFRGIIELRAKTPTELEMEVSKRHRQANLRDDAGNLVTRQALQLGTDEITWTRSMIPPAAPRVRAGGAPAPSRPSGRPAKANKDAVAAFIKDLRRQKKPENAIIRMVSEEFQYSTKQARRLVTG